VTLSRKDRLVSYKLAKILKGGRHDKMLRMLSSNRTFKNVKDYYEINLHF
jgi:hypothetical protein